MSATNCWFLNSFPVEMEKETQVIARGLRRHDPALLDRLIEQYRFRLFRYLLVLTGNRDAAEELFQDTWIRVLERGHQYNQKWKFEFWLFTIARNLVIDRQRRRAPRYVDLLTGFDEAENRPGFDSPRQPSAFDSLAQREEGERVHAALACLPAVYREVLALRFQEDMKLEEIAEVVAAPLPTVKSRLYRGLAAMRRLLEGGEA